MDRLRCMSEDLFHLLGMVLIGEYGISWSRTLMLSALTDFGECLRIELILLYQRYLGGLVY